MIVPEHARKVRVVRPESPLPDEDESSHGVSYTGPAPHLVVLLVAALLVAAVFAG